MSAERTKAILQKLLVVYGKKFLDSTEMIPTKLLQAEWTNELDGFSDDDIAKALSMLRDRHQDYPPTLYQFRALCVEARRSKVISTTRLPSKGEPPDPKVWAAIKSWVEKINVTDKH